MTVGVYPETKHPSYFASRGLPLEPLLVASLRSHHLDRPNAPVLVQSFETANLRALAAVVPVPLVQLVDRDGAPYDRVAAGDPLTYRDLLSPAGLADVATYAAAVGLHAGLVLDDAGRSTGLADRAHAAGLLVHAWTARDENQFLAAPFRRGDDPCARGDGQGQTVALLEAGVDGVFSDHPDTTAGARRVWLDRQDTTRRRVPAA